MVTLHVACNAAAFGCETDRGSAVTVGVRETDLKADDCTASAAKAVTEGNTAASVDGVVTLEEQGGLVGEKLCSFKDKVVSANAVASRSTEPSTVSAAVRATFASRASGATGASRPTTTDPSSALGSKCPS